jgi:hypothetical protein
MAVGGSRASTTGASFGAGVPFISLLSRFFEEKHAMKKHSLKLALLCSTVVAAASIVGPAFAQDCGGVATANKCKLALWTKRGDVLIQITDGGVTRKVWCHHELEVDKDGPEHFIEDESDPMLRREAFNVCVGGNFEVGNNGDEMINLKPATFSPPNGPGTLGRPFVEVRGSDGKIKVIFLETNGQTIDCGDEGQVPLYRLDKQDLDGNPATKADTPLPLGTLVNVITENQPVPGKCIGVRTTFQYRVGTCKIWKVRKYFNACSSAKRITQIKEFEQVDSNMNAAGSQAGPGGSLVAVGQEDNEDHYITLMTGNTGANPGGVSTPPFQKSAAGSVEDDDFEALEFCGCRTFPSTTDEDAFTTAQVERDEHAWLELFLSYFPGGVNLQGKGKNGSEKIITFHIDVE